MTPREKLKACKIIIQGNIAYIGKHRSEAAKDLLCETFIEATELALAVLDDIVEIDTLNVKGSSTLREIGEDGKNKIEELLAKIKI